MQEQRKNKRFDLQLPLEIVRAGDKSIAANGQTRNISSSGVLFVADADMELGEPIEYLLTLPSGNQRIGEVKLRCVGKIVRFHEPASENGTDRAVAVTLERHEFQRLKD